MSGALLSGHGSAKPDFWPCWTELPAPAGSPKKHGNQMSYPGGDNRTPHNVRFFTAVDRYGNP
jgi:hypothetical protein